MSKKSKTKQIPHSISLTDFNAGKFEKKVDNSNSHPVLKFLKREKKAHNLASIMKATGMKEEAVRGQLRKLKKKGLVVHKQPYFTFKR